MTQSSWYKINNLDDGVSRILEAHVAADWRCNIWHVRGRDRDLIIDTGLGLRPIAKDIAMLAERPVIALCTHSHHDHAGGLCQFETRLGHVAEADIFANPTREATVANLLKPHSISPSIYLPIYRWIAIMIHNKLTHGANIAQRQLSLRLTA